MRATDKWIDVADSLLDRQVVDGEGHLICKVDDIEIREEAGQLHLTAILEGPGALGPRLGEPFGRWLTAIWTRLSHHEQPGRLPMSDVLEVDSAVHLSDVAADAGIQGFESWMRVNVIGRLPGANR